MGSRIFGNGDGARRFRSGDSFALDSANGVGDETRQAVDQEPSTKNSRQEVEQRHVWPNRAAPVEVTGDSIIRALRSVQNQ